MLPINHGSLASEESDLEETVLQVARKGADALFVKRYENIVEIIIVMGVEGTGFLQAEAFENPLSVMIFSQPTIEVNTSGILDDRYFMPFPLVLALAVNLPIAKVLVKPTTVCAPPVPIVQLVESFTEPTYALERSILAIR